MGLLPIKNYINKSATIDAKWLARIEIIVGSYASKDTLSVIHPRWFISKKEKKKICLVKDEPFFITPNLLYLSLSIKYNRQLQEFQNLLICIPQSYPQFTFLQNPKKKH